VPVPPVVVEIQAEQSAADLVNTLLEACSRAVATTNCVLAGSREEAEQPTAVAIVNWLGPRTVQIQVGLREDRRWRAREINFSSADEPSEMWRAVGFATGTLVTGGSKPEQPTDSVIASQPAGQNLATSGAVPAGPGPQVARRRPAESSTQQGSASSAARGWIAIDFEATAGPGLGTGTLRVGGMLRGSWNHRSGLLASITLTESVGLGERTGVEAWWTTLGAGPGYGVRVGRTAVELRAEAIAERLAVSATLDDRSESGFRWVGGARIGLDAAWQPAKALGIVAGVNVRWLAGWTDATVHLAPVGTESSLSYGCGLGLRLALR
jgi:hypothetical protein